MFVMMTMMSTGGLMVTSNFANFRPRFRRRGRLGAGARFALPFALTVDRLLNGSRGLSSAGCRIGSAAKIRWASPSGSRRRRSCSCFSSAATRQPSSCFRASSSSVGGNFLAVPVDPRGHVRKSLRHNELWLPLYRARRRFDPGRPGRGGNEGRDWKLDAGVRGRGGDGYRDCAACPLRAKADARRLSLRTPSALGDIGGGFSLNYGPGALSQRGVAADMPQVIYSLHHRGAGASRSLRRGRRAPLYLSGPSSRKTIFIQTGVLVALGFLTEAPPPRVASI